ncbi:uncharacterized protein LOC141621203 [Silene latifolia]|uniref:uncharacterized protein LOC141621203 n=1 Tax=Silene latifolia TaxID=37657 RepID=UPI003D7869E2
MAATTRYVQLYSSTEDAKSSNEYRRHRRNESLQLCTEGIGSESLDYVEDLKVEFPGTWLDYNKNDRENDHGKNNSNCKMNARGNSGDQYRRRGRRRTTNGMTFPPPISCIGKTGKPGVWFQSSRQDGRFILQEIKIPTYERFHASREDGRLRLCFIQQSDEEDDNDADDDDGNDASEAVDKDDSSAVENEEEKEGEEQIKDETFVKDDIERGHS